MKLKSTDGIIRLKSIEIDGLFNMFNYQFDYENIYNTSIVIAPNGCGKTTIFKFISFLLNPTEELLQTVFTVPYKKITCVLSNGNKVSIEKIVTKTVKSNIYLSADDEKQTSRSIKYYDYIYSEVSADGSERKFSFAENFPENLGSTILSKEIDNGGSIEGLREQITYEQLAKQGRKISIKGIPETFLEHLSKMYDKKWEAFVSSNDKSGISWLPLLTALWSFRKFNYPNVCFINANRVETFMGSARYRHPRRYQDGERLSSANPIEAIRRDIGYRISRAMMQYDIQMDKAKNVLPKRYLSNDSTVKLSHDEFICKWEEYCQELSKYHSIGLLSSDFSNLELGDIEQAYQTKSDFLNIYLDEYSKTLQSLKEIYSKLELFANIINKRNETTRKVIKFNRAGIYVMCGNDRIPLDALSSGEKNDLIMFYCLIFDAKAGSLILVDEPEISLHIEWQEEYIDRLLELCEINNFQAIVATHAPHIINDHIELYAKRVMTYVEK